MRTISTIIFAALLPALASAQPETWTDGARTTLAEDLDTTETGIDLTSGSAFPSTPTSPGYFTITVRSVATPSTFEIMRCTARSTNTLTCSRDCVTGTCDGTGTSFLTGDNVYLSITAASLIRGLNGVGEPREVTFNESDVPGGADNVLIDNNTLVLREASTASISGTGVRLIGRRVSSSFPVRFSWFRPSSAVPNFAMPDMWNTQTMCVSPGTSATSMSGYFDPSLNSGTFSQPSTANTSRFTRRFRTLITSAGSANSSARVGGHYLIYPGSGYAGGTFYAYSWTLDTDNGTSRVHVGLGAALNSSIDPSAHLNTVYVGADAADTNLSIYSNDGSGTATSQAACGANFPKAGGLYSTAISIAPNASTYYVVLRREDSAVADCTATVTTDIPSSGQQLRWIVQANTGATASAVAISLNGACAYVPREVQGYAP